MNYYELLKSTNKHDVQLFSFIYEGENIVQKTLGFPLLSKVEMTDENEGYFTIKDSVDSWTYHFSKLQYVELPIEGCNFTLLYSSEHPNQRIILVPDFESRKHSIRLFEDDFSTLLLSLID